MRTIQKIEHYIKIRKFIVALAIGLSAIDIVCSIINPAYQSNLILILTLGFTTYHLLGECLRSFVKKRKVAKGILMIYLVINGFSIYYIILNILKI